ncbi:MAG: hypothetical protein M1839_006225 [Geoglossum umbratile]|nr:MAG: hypothetical protein M1839_006225 [Geoglossum umbratile]
MFSHEDTRNITGAKNPFGERDVRRWQLTILTAALLPVVCCAYYIRSHAKRRIAVPAFGVPPGPLGPWVAAFRFVTDSAALVRDGYGPDKKSFKISTPARWVVVATDDAVLKELQDADERILSMQAAANERNSIQYTLSSTIHSNPYHVGVIKMNLTQRLSKVLPDIVEELGKTFSSSSAIGQEWTQISTHHLMLECITTSTNRVLVGQALAHDREYLESLSKLSGSVSRAGLVIDLAPRFLKPILALYLVPKHGPLGVFLAKLGPLFEERRRTMEKLDGDWPDKPNDAIQWVLESAPPGSSLYELCVRILYIAVSAIHTSTVSITNALYDLATHPEFQPPMRDEIESVLESHGGWTKQALAKMKKVDSSLRESQRLNPVTTVTMMRRAQQPHTLADGTHLSKGQWVVAPAWAMNRSAQSHTNPDAFDAFRFSRLRAAPGGESRHQMSNPEDGYISFGAGRHACPGRFFAAAELKVLLAYILQNYEFKLPDDGGGTRPRNSFYLFSCLPDFEAKLVFRVRGPGHA